MEKLNLKKHDTYKIEVNDNGDYIEFDLVDISLPLKVLEASKKISEIDKRFIEELEILKKTYPDKTDYMCQEKELEFKKCQEMRIEFDKFLGNDACKKIFGDKNYYGMFGELFDALEPHFKKMNIDIKKSKKVLAEKYLSEEKDVI